MNNFLGTLGLCRRAGKLLYGFDSVAEEIKKPASKAAGVIIAEDLSVHLRKIRRSRLRSEYFNVGNKADNGKADRYTCSPRRGAVSIHNQIMLSLGDIE